MAGLRLRRTRGTRQSTALQKVPRGRPLHMSPTPSCAQYLRAGSLQPARQREATIGGRAGKQKSKERMINVESKDGDKDERVRKGSGKGLKEEETKHNRKMLREHQHGWANASAAVNRADQGHTAALQTGPNLRHRAPRHVGASWRASRSSCRPTWSVQSVYA